MERKISVNADALARLLKQVASGGFVTHELGVKWAADERRVSMVLVEDSDA